MSEYSIRHKAVRVERKPMTGKDVEINNNLYHTLIWHENLGTK